MDKRILWIWLSLACTPGSHTFAKLYEKFKSLEAIYSATDKEINSAIDPKSSDRIALLDKELDKANEIFDFCQRMNVGIVTYEDTSYPQALRKIPNPPVLLYYRGSLPDFNKYISIAVVGTRNLTSYGRQNAYNLSYDLAKSGALIVSGMALGIDGMAHTAALTADMPTVAVLGSGINICYPSGHLKLAREIVKRGCVITEYPPNTKPFAYNFPCRNRIISGISNALLLIEGTERSGALITARTAKEQGKSVYALPGNVGSKTSEASNLLLKNGAKLATSAEDIIADYEKSGYALLNRFNLLPDRPNINTAMKEFGTEAITADDDIFTPSRKRITKSKDLENIQDSNNSSNTENNTLKSNNANTSNDTATAFHFDATALKIYKRIPEGVECSYDSLTGDGIDARDVATAVLKLQIGGFVTIHPGDFVSRKFKA